MIWLLIWLNLAAQNPQPVARKLRVEPVRVDTSHNYAVNVIKKYEGFRPKPYRLFGDNYKGYGHLIYTDFSPVNEAQADSILRADLNGKLKQINLKTNKKTRLLLAVYAYNCGNAKALYKYVGKPEFRDKYLSCVYANGKVLPRLKQRRIDELKILDL